MKRIFIDILSILLLFSFVRYIENKDIHSTDSIEERIKQYEIQVQNQNYYKSNEKIWINQTDENTAGKIGEKASKIIMNVLDRSMDFLGYFLDELWK